MSEPKTKPEVWETAMRRALEVAARSHAPFGAVICRIDQPGTVLFEGGNTSAQDPTGHAEVNALRALAAAGHPVRAREFALVTTAEPCPMCAAASWWAEIGLIVYGTSIERLIELGWRQLATPVRELLARSRGIEPPAVIGPWRQEWTDPLYRR